METNKKDRTILAQNLVRLRKKYGYSQEDLAKISGVSRRTIAMYETCPSKPPLQNIEKLAKALSVKIEELVDFKEEGKNLENELSSIDARTLKKIKQLLSLTPEQRHIVYSLVESLLAKNNTHDK